MERSKRYIRKDSDMRYNYAIENKDTDKMFNYNMENENYSTTKNGEKSNGFTDEQIHYFLKSAEGFREVPYLDKNGNITIGYGKLVKKLDKGLSNEAKKQELKNYTNGEFKRDYPDGKMTEKQATDLLIKTYNNNWGHMKNAIEKEGVDISKMPNNLLTAFKLLSYGGIGNLGKQGAFKALKEAENNGYDKSSVNNIVGRVTRQYEDGGVGKRLSAYRAMIVGEYNFDEAINKINKNDSLNIYSGEYLEKFNKDKVEGKVVSSSDNENINIHKDPRERLSPVKFNYNINIDNSSLPNSKLFNSK